MSKDVIIIGAGIIGCATAYYLAKSGCKVTVLEKSNSVGDGGSSRNGGGVRQSGRDPRELPLMMYGVQHMWPNLSNELEIDVEYCQGGNLRLGKTEDHRRILEQLTEKACECGLDVQMISGEDARKINEHLSYDVICASWCPSDGHANPLKATLAYYVRARDLGVTFITGIEVKSLIKKRGKILGVETNSGDFFSSSVLLAAGYESRDLAETVGLDLPINSEKIETLVTEAMPTMFSQMLGTAMADFYGHQTKDNSFVFGGSSGYEAFNRDNGTPVTSSIVASATCRGIMGYFPTLTSAKVVRTWGGWVDKCVDGVPILGDVEENPGLYLACAFCGHGFGIAPPVALTMAELIMTGRTTIDISEFHYNRFKSKI